jgi:hypothetical protein
MSSNFRHSEVHKKKQQFPCAFCHLRFATENLLSFHLESFHKVEAFNASALVAKSSFSFAGCNQIDVSTVVKDHGSINLDSNKVVDLPEIPEFKSSDIFVVHVLNKDIQAS